MFEDYKDNVEFRNDLDRIPFIKSNIGKEILNCGHCGHCMPMTYEYQRYNFLEEGNVVFCNEKECCVHSNDVCPMLELRFLREGDKDNV